MISVCRPGGPEDIAMSIHSKNMLRRDFVKGLATLPFIAYSGATAEGAAAKGPTDASMDSREAVGANRPSGNEDGIAVENADLRLLLGGDGQVRSLLHKPSGQECLFAGAGAAAFSITQNRPYNNELQLKYPANPRSFAASSLRREGDRLVVRFEPLNIVATIGLRIAESYIAFALEKLDYLRTEFGDQRKAPVDALVLLQLPVRNREHFGEWLNVMWDKDVAVNVLAADPYTRVYAEERQGYRLLRAEAVSEVKGLGTKAALITTAAPNLLKCIDKVERDCNLPLGVSSRRRQEYRYSYYETGDANPRNIDEHIAFAKKGGFRAIQMVWTAFASSIGHFPWRPEYPNGMEDLKEVVRRIKDAGMAAGAHFWYNKAQKTDPYVTPVPDYRLNLRRTFTLASRLEEDSTTIVVEESPQGCTLDESRRILKVGHELIEYAGYTTERPYRFTGCTRGALKTHSEEHAPGFIFGLLDVDTWPIWVRFDQRTSIQQEVAERIGRLYSGAGFDFVYFDGAEDVPPPYWYNVAIAQLTVYNRLRPAPLFAEGALKSHFNWHILTRGNAFDVFKPEAIKEATRQNQMDDARYTAQDFTAINFGWIDYAVPGPNTIGLQPDMLEYVCSRAAAWECPISLEGSLERFKAHPRTPDNLEVIRRWEEARLGNYFSEQQRDALKNPAREHILLLDEDGRFELRPYEQLQRVAGGNPHIRAFVFERRGRTWVVYWHTSGAGKLVLDLAPEKTRLFKELGEEVQLTPKAGGIVVSVDSRRYLQAGDQRTKVIAAFRNART